MRAENLQNVFELTLELAYDCEQHLTDFLPKMVDAASSPGLRAAFDQYFENVREALMLLERIFSRLDRAAGAEHNPVVRAITDESEKLIGHIDRSPLLDAVLIMHGNQIAHYQSALYESIESFARTLNLHAEAELLVRTRAEKQLAAQALMQIAGESVNREAAGFQNTPHIFPLV